MSSEFINTTEKVVSDPQLVAQKQVVLASQWAELYEDSNSEQGPSSAEIVLRNPAMYLGDIDPNLLPDELQDKWQKFIEYCDFLAKQATGSSAEQNSNLIGVEKILALVRDGEYNPDYRGDMAEVMRQSSSLFAESVKHIPGNSKYYEGNVQGATSRLEREQSRRLKS